MRAEARERAIDLRRVVSKQVIYRRGHDQLTSRHHREASGYGTAPDHVMSTFLALQVLLAQKIAEKITTIKVSIKVEWRAHAVNIDMNILRESKC